MSRPSLWRSLAAVALAAALCGSVATAQDEADPAASASNLALNFAHLDHLSRLFEVEGQELRGVWIYAEPGLEPGAPYQFRGAAGEGVTDIDDIARAAIAYLWAAELGVVDHALEYARGQLEFVMAMQDDDGEFFNFVFSDGSINRLGITSRKGAGFWSARALWSLAEGMHTFQESDPEFYQQLRSAFLLGVGPFASAVGEQYGEYLDVNGLRAPAWFPGDGSDVASILLLGLTAYLELEDDETSYLLASRLAAGLTQFQYGPPQQYPYLAHQSFARDPLQWHAWGSRQSQALARAARVMAEHEDADDWLASAEAEAGNFFVQLLASQGPIESMRPAVKSGPQIAFGMESLASGFFELNLTTGKEIYAELGGLMTSWLGGNNELREAMYDPASGRTYDGLERGVINRNSGAESTITALLALLQADRSEVAKDALAWQWLWKLDDVVVELETGSDFGEPPAVEVDTAASGQLVAILQPGAAVVVDTVVPRAGQYRVQALHRNDPWSASADIALGQQRMGTVSNSGSGPAHHQLTDLGVFELPVGEARFIVSHASGDELRFDALVLRPLLTQKLYGREGERLLLVKSWAEDEVVLDASSLVADALAAIGAEDRGELQVRVYDRLSNLQAEASGLPPFGFALVDFTSTEPLPDLRLSNNVDTEPVSVEFAFSQDAFHGLELGELFNNDAFSDNRNPAKGNFDSRSGALGATYMAERAPAANEVFELGGVPLLFPPSGADANNVAMFGQRLLVPSGNYAAVWILGSSEQGNYQQPLTLEYTDGSSETVQLGLSDWCQLPRYDEPAVLEFDQRRGTGGAIERIACRIYLQRVSVDSSKELALIGLPDRETMHAFAITLEEP